MKLPELQAELLKRSATLAAAEKAYAEEGDSPTGPNANRMARLEKQMNELNSRVRNHRERIRSIEQMIVDRLAQFR